MRTSIVIGTAAGLVGAVLAAGPPQRAEACGGCFSPPDSITAVEAHRMVISLSTERTTLWDQIRYTGNPADFVWVLPVPSAAATIELAEPAFFDNLQNQTAPQIAAPPLPQPDCPPPPDDYWGGGGPQGVQDASAGSPDAAPVDVFHEETVGPYETVTIGSTDANALRDWLVAHSYNVPDATLPTIQYYADRGNVFVVLRLAPDEGVSAMQPIRVRYPGYMATFPLKMVTVGASGTLELTLWVIAEQRYAVKNYGTRTIPVEELVFDWNTVSANYNEVFVAQVAAGGGAAWIAEYATPLNYLWFESPTEVEVASVGLPNPYITRLRTSALVDNLGEDLELGPSAEAGEISRFIQVQNAINVPSQQCPDWNGDGNPDTWEEYYADEAQPAPSFMTGCRVLTGAGRGLPLSGLGLAAALAFVTLVIVRRARRRGR